ncbi:MAG: FG-GAP-like repeat-containing protein, partial [Candidatus Eisenbacteria bacterium]|nr:FG-GAP-like repeat-containing protein [Candidatus Eisenbacteria bacterium]
HTRYTALSRGLGDVYKRQQEDCTLGIAVATAGDVNGDGYSDVIVGADGYDHGQSREGGAFVYLGSAAGLSTTPAWAFESDQVDALMGTAAGCAGDVNGDGYSDVLVGSEIYDNGEQDEGRAYLFEGSSTGLSAAPAWIADGDQAGARFGSVTRTAGDVNGDGFSDVIVGAPYYDNGQTDEGRVYVYEGSSTGLSTTPAWMVEGDQSEATFGASLGTAGDVNGDGYSDVIVGAVQYDNGQSQEGAAWIYMGSAGGLAISPAWVQEGNQAGAFFGCSVGTAGDVNGDGYSDIIVGAMLYDNGQSEEGRAFVYHGSASGVATAAAWAAEGDQTNAFFGYSVAAAGDVNGDGFSDVIVSAIYYNNGQAAGGRTFAYYGNGGDGLDRLPLQATTDDSKLIALLGASDSDTAFRLRALGRTCTGRGHVRLQYEVKPAGMPLDGTALGDGPLVDTGAPGPAGSVVGLSELASGLTSATLYHWRLRTVSDSPFAPFSPWFGMTGNALSEADLRTQEPLTGVDEDGAAAPQRAGDRLGAPVPNPLVSLTRFAYTLSEGGRSRLAVYDIAGREVAVLRNGVLAAGRYEASWDGRDERGREVRSGVYFLRLERGGRGQVDVRKLIKVR